jgi:hypothetical protein
MHMAVIDLVIYLAATLVNPVIELEIRLAVVVVVAAVPLATSGRIVATTQC